MSITSHLSLLRFIYNTVLLIFYVFSEAHTYKTILMWQVHYRNMHILCSYGNLWHNNHLIMIMVCSHRSGRESDSTVVRTLCCKLRCCGFKSSSHPLLWDLFPRELTHRWLVLRLNNSTHIDLCGRLRGLTVASWITDHYHLSLNLDMGISEGCFIFYFA